MKVSNTFSITTTLSEDGSVGTRIGCDASATREQSLHMIACMAQALGMIAETVLGKWATEKGWDMADVNGKGSEKLQ